MPDSKEPHQEPAPQTHSEASVRDAPQSGVTTGQTGKFERMEAKLDDILAKLPDPNPPPGKAHRLAHWIETGWATRLLAAVGIWLVLATGVGIYYEYLSRAEERRARIEEAEFRRLAQIATAWEVLLTPVGGDIGKGNALNTLVAAGQTISNADFSCKAIGTWADGKCVRAPQFNDVVLGEGDFWVDDLRRYHDTGWSYDVQFYLDAVDFEGAVITDLQAEMLDRSVKLVGVTGKNWRVRNAAMAFLQPGPPSLYEGFSCKNCKFFDSQLHWDLFTRLEGPTLVNSDISVPLSKKAEIDVQLAKLTSGLPITSADGGDEVRFG